MEAEAMPAMSGRCTCAPSAVPMTIEELCPQCRESRRIAASSNVERRIEQGLRRLGTEHAPPAGWKERVLARVRGSRRRRRVVLVVIAAAIAVGLALLAIVWRRSRSSDSDFKLEITIERAHH